MFGELFISHHHAPDCSLFRLILNVIYWIDVQTTDPTEAQRLLSAGLEEKITRWLV
jgi:hypothetical protein